MKPRQSTGLFKRIFSSRLFIIFGALVLILLIVANVRVYFHAYKIQQEISAMELEIQSLSQKKLASMEILRYVMSNNFVEEKARTELNMKAPGEKVVIVKERAETSRPVVADGDSGQNMSNPLKWWYYFSRHSLPVISSDAG